MVLNQRSSNFIDHANSEQHKAAMTHHTYYTIIVKFHSWPTILIIKAIATWADTS